jgi:hypothetical protein
MNRLYTSPNSHELDTIEFTLTPEIGGIAVGDSLKEPLIDVKTMPNEREKHFVDIDTLTQIAVGCGDERCVCKNSLKGLESEDGNLEHFIRCYGGPFGLAHTLMLNIANVKEPNNIGIRNSLSSHKSAVGLVISRLTEAGMVPMLHSDNSSEGGTVFNGDSDNPDVGCAFAKKLGIITDLMNRDYVVEASKEYINSQNGNPSEIESIMHAKWQMVEQGVDENFNYNRADFCELVNNVAVLDGPHKDAEDTALVLNYTNKVSRPTPDKPFYDVDVKQVAEILIKLFPEIDFDANTLLSSIELQSITTAHALALGTRKEGSNLEMLALEVYGDRMQALLEIQQLIDDKKAD